MSEINFNRCRACASLTTCPEKMVSLYEESLSEVFTLFTSLKVASNDCLPSHICIECFGKLSNFKDFRQCCINSDAYFREHIISDAMKVECLDEIVVKCEENDANPEIKYEIYESECNEESSTHSDSESNVTSHDVSSNITNSVDHLHPFDNTKYICDYCGKSFDKKSSIGSHMTMHKNEGRKPKTFACTVDGCRKVFDRRRVFNRHNLKAHNIKPKSTIKAKKDKKVKLLCPKCPKWSTIQHKIDAHIRQAHEGLKPYKCPQEDCPKEFCKYRSYMYHLKFAHITAETIPPKKEFRCTYDGCSMEYGLINSLKVHIQRCHLGIIKRRRDQRLICDQCGRSFVDGYNLKKHILTHTGNLPFACKICPKAFKTKCQLKIHTMRHDKNKPFYCSVCGAGKTTRKELEHHLNFHTKEITYPCKECPRVFTSYGAVSRHVRIHHRNHKPYICTHCDRAFTKAETLKNHVMTHTGEKPFACTICGHRFIQGVALKTHMRTHAKK